MSDPAGERWHIDRRIPVSLLVGLFFQLVAIIMAASVAYERLGTHTDKLAEHASRLGVLETGGSDTRAQLARMTAILESIDQRLARQEQMDRSGTP